MVGCAWHAVHIRTEQGTCSAFQHARSTGPLPFSPPHCACPPSQPPPLPLLHRRLQAYVHARILHFNSQPALQQKLGPEGAAALQTATQELLGQAGPDGAATSGAEAGAAAAAAAAAAARPPELALVFKHDCLHLGCADLHCKL